MSADASSSNRSTRILSAVEGCTVTFADVSLNNRSTGNLLAVEKWSLCVDVYTLTFVCDDVLLFARYDCVPTVSLGSLYSLFRTIRHIDQLPLNVYQRAGFVLDACVLEQQTGQAPDVVEGMRKRGALV